jgi:hypothetical protein
VPLTYEKLKLPNENESGMRRVEQKQPNENE